MPIIYGSTTNTVTPLDSSRIGKIKVKEKSRSSWTSLLRILVTVLEVGATIATLPLGGVGGAAVGVGIGLAAATANLGISAAEGNISGLSTAFDFGSSFLPLAGGLNSARKITNAGKEITKESLDRSFGFGSKVGKLETRQAKSEANFQRRVNRVSSRLNKNESKLASKTQLSNNRVSKRWDKFYGLGSKNSPLDNPASRKAARFAKRYYANNLTPAEAGLFEALNTFGVNDARLGIMQRMFDDIASAQPNVFSTAISTSNYVRDAEKIGIKGRTALSESIGRDNRLYVDTLKKFDAIALKFKTSISDIKKTFDDLYSLHNKVLQFSVFRKFSNSSFLKQIEIEAGRDNAFIAKMLQEAYRDPIRNQTYFGRLALKQTAKRAATGFAIKEMKASLSESDLNIFTALENRLKRSSKLKNTTGFYNSKLAYNSKNLIEETIGSMSSEGQKTIADVVQRGMFVSFQELFFSFEKHSDASVIARLIKTTGSSDFNDKWVQTLQLVDANDFGRYGPERAYQFLKGKIEKLLEKTSFNKAWVSVKKVIKESASLKEAFIEAGGVMVPGKSGQTPGNYLFGFKIINKHPTNGWYTVLLRFVKETTNNKHDVLIRATAKDLELLETEGVSYYWRVGKRKGWFISRGGAKVGSGLKTLSSSLSLFLSFIPIPALRNLMSIVSNWVENISSMVKGDYFKEWFGKFERAFVRTSINRSARLATRVVVGNLYKQAYLAKVSPKIVEQAQSLGKSRVMSSLSSEVSSAQLNSLIDLSIAKEFKVLSSQAIRRSNWVGRELQRISSVALSTLESTGGSGLFEFKFSDYGSRFSKKFITSTLPTAFKGVAMRKSVAVFNKAGKVNQAKALIGSKRNLSQITRIYSAVTPNRKVKPLRSLTNFKL